MSEVIQPPLTTPFNLSKHRFFSYSYYFFFTFSCFYPIKFHRIVTILIDAVRGWGELRAKLNSGHYLLEKRLNVSYILSACIFASRSHPIFFLVASLILISNPNPYVGVEIYYYNVQKLPSIVVNKSEISNLITNRTIERMINKQEFHYTFTCFFCHWRICFYAHSVHYRHCT